MDKAKARFRRLQNSPSAQTIVIAFLSLRQVLYTKTLSTAAQMDIIGETNILLVNNSTAVKNMIISASRRTDIPAFFTEWFMNRIRSGHVLIRNPLNSKQIRKVPLTPDVVDCIVFWTKNPAKLLPHLPELAGFNFYFQFTLTPYGRKLEPGLPEKSQLLDTFQKLSRKIGSHKVIWRYDPIILSKKISVSFHEEAFTAMAESLKGYTRHCVISFLDLYKKIEKNLEGRGIFPFTYETMLEIAERFARIAQNNDLTLATCAEKIDLSSLGISHGKCIDDDLINRIAGRKITMEKDKTQRPLCGCIESIDIGAYNTCSHGCLYCYANSRAATTKKNCQQHDPAAGMLIGKPEKNDKVTTRKKVSFFDPQHKLF